MMNRSVRLTVFIQIYRPSLVSVKFEAKISPLGKNSTVNFCESQLIAFAGPNLVANNVLTLKDTSVVNQAEKLQFFNLQLSILPSTTALYNIYITYTGKIKAEPCSVDYLLTENNSTKKVSLKYHNDCFHFPWFLKDFHKGEQTLRVYFNKPVSIISKHE
ncbi:unnamed protein product [Schistosoma curassoni]|uniref:Hydrocephalus-inducing protein homolog n=1 Tax=Schistosoma curassoni TaxID=6186 RepID=A0A183L613_9TREM|nr:unnamed protein product [Schistosoma curassoni]